MCCLHSTTREGGTPVTWLFTTGQIGDYLSVWFPTSVVGIMEITSLFGPHICHWDHGDYLSVWYWHLSWGSWGSLLWYPHLSSGSCSEQLVIHLGCSYSFHISHFPFLLSLGPPLNPPHSPPLVHRLGMCDNRPTKAEGLHLWVQLGVLSSVS